MELRSGSKRMDTFSKGKEKNIRGRKKIKTSSEELVNAGEPSASELSASGSAPVGKTQEPEKMAIEIEDHDQMEEQLENPVPFPVESVHPLLIDHVLERIFKKFKYDIDTLKICRSVCQNWNNIATKALQKQFRKREKFTLFEGPFANSRIFGTKLNEKTMKSITEIQKNAYNALHVDFVLPAKFFIEANKDILRQFFATCGPFIQRLLVKLDTSNVGTIKFTQDTFDGNLNLAQLQQLGFCDDSKDTNSYQESGSWQFYDSIVRGSSGRLQNICVWFLSNGITAEEERKICELPHSPSKTVLNLLSKHVRHLELNMPMGNEELQALMSIDGLQLEFFEVDFNNKQKVAIDSELLHQFLKKHSKSLEFINLGEGPVTDGLSKIIVRFPTMTALKCFRSESADSKIRNGPTKYEFATFEYAEQLPGLAELDLDLANGKEEDWSAFFKSVSPAQHVVCLHLPKCFQHAEYVSRFPKLFPTLNTLELWFWLTPQHENMLQSVFLLDKLKRLIIKCEMKQKDQNIDHILTGIPPAICHRLFRNANNTSKVNRYMNGIQPKISITAMTSLEELHFQMLNSNHPFITDVSAALAFSKMDNLKFIEAPKYGMPYEDIERSKGSLKTDKISVNFVPNFDEIFTTGERMVDYEYFWVEDDSSDDDEHGFDMDQSEDDEFPEIIDDSINESQDDTGA